MAKQSDGINTAKQEAPKQEAPKARPDVHCDPIPLGQTAINNLNQRLANLEAIVKELLG